MGLVAQLRTLNSRDAARRFAGHVARLTDGDVTPRLHESGGVWKAALDGEAVRREYGTLTDPPRPFVHQAVWSTQREGGGRGT